MSEHWRKYVMLIDSIQLRDLRTIVDDCPSAPGNADIIVCRDYVGVSWSD